MLFNDECFDPYFHLVIQQTFDAFPFAVLRQVATVDPETRSVSLKYHVIDSGIGNLSSPLEQIQYEIDGAVQYTDGLIFVLKGTRVANQDLIYRSDRNIFYRVMGTTDYGSHIDLDVITKETGSNFSPLADTGPIHLSEHLVNELGTIV